MHGPATTTATAAYDKPNGTPRPRTDYRAVRRNAAAVARMLPQWRESVAEAANTVARLGARANQANGAREAAAAALLRENVQQTGLRRDVIVASAMLDFYRAEKQTRPVARIVRDLERSVRSAAARS